MEPPAFWLELKQITDCNAKPKFDVLSELMCTLVALPHSSACVERIFSQVNIVKTEQCNKLMCETVSNRSTTCKTSGKEGWSLSHMESMWQSGGRYGQGRCRKRYEETVKLHSRQGTLNVDAIEVVDSVAECWQLTINHDYFKVLCK